MLLELSGDLAHHCFGDLEESGMACVFFVIQESNGLFRIRSFVDGPICEAFKLSTTYGNDDEACVVDILVVYNHGFDVFGRIRWRVCTPSRECLRVIAL